MTEPEPVPFSFVDEHTHEPCPTRGKLLCTLTHRDHRHIAAHMVPAAEPDAGGLTEAERQILAVEILWARVTPTLDLFESILASRIATAKAEALREAADELSVDWAKNGHHQGIPGCYSSGYEHWLRRRADRLTDGV